MNERKFDAKHYCGYFRHSDMTCALLAAMGRTDTRCKVWRGEESVECRHLKFNVARRGKR
ncbi:hypothetical protein VK70_14575 [Paenibacillus durus ATCC 35681]|uniref:Uncharacterized protein n=1 Tax=Paenibacillus durus ATCC 35681 TaxID=1333534 RepID=A0A0F7FAL2_PAEDU|nr:hypothetical protein VK70_14575 [Paenibacillus durus ATCC 35681]